MVCWSSDQMMWKCPERSAAVKAEQEKKQYVSSAALNCNEAGGPAEV